MTKVVKPITDKSLRTWNIVAGFAHLAQLILILVLATDFTLPVTATPRPEPQRWWRRLPHLGGQVGLDLQRNGAANGLVLLLVRELGCIALQQRHLPTDATCLSGEGAETGVHA